MKSNQSHEERDVKEKDDSTINWYDAIKLLTAGSVGNALEWFSFASFGYFAQELAHSFFPMQSSTSGLLSSFGVFGAAFLMRPLGGIFFGWLGDKYGRTIALRYSLFLMGIPTVMVGCLPSYQSIGIAAPFLLVCLRLFQGLAVGGEWVGCQIYVMEIAPRGRKGLYAGILCLTNCGFLLSTALASLIRATLSKQQVLTWGWRIPFLMGIIVIAFGVWMRRGLKEGGEFVEHKSKVDAVDEYPNIGEGFMNSFKTQWSKMLLVLGMTFQSHVQAYLVWVWLAIFLSKLRDHPMEHAFAINTGALFLTQLLAVLAGYVSDIVGAWNMIMTGSALTLVLSPILFNLLSVGDEPIIVVCYVVLGICGALVMVPLPIVLMEIIDDVGSRYMTLGISYNVGAAVIAGTTPLLATDLSVHIFDSAPGIYLSFSAMMTLATVVYIRCKKIQKVTKIKYTRLKTDEENNQTDEIIPNTTSILFDANDANDCD